MKSLTILHVDSEETWRGGQRQVFELSKGLNMRGHRNIIVCREGGGLADRARGAGMEVITLPFRGEWDIMTGWKLGKLVKAEILARNGGELNIRYGGKTKTCDTKAGQRITFTP